MLEFIGQKGLWREEVRESATQRIHVKENKDTN